MANPVHRTLVADTELTVTLEGNYGAVEVALVSGAATTYFNTANVVVGPVAGAQDGNHVVTAALPVKTVQDATAGAASIVRLRSVGTPTVTVTGL